VSRKPGAIQSEGHFRKHCTVPPFAIGRRKLYPREAIYAWWRAKAGIAKVAGTDQDWFDAINGKD